MDIVLSWFQRCTYDPARDVPDQSGRVVLVTGGYSGIGYETAKQLAAKGATVYLACRSEERTRAAIARLEGEVPGARVRFLQVDLDDVRSVRRAGEAFMKKESRLDVLVHNAGRMNGAYELSKDGVELTIAVNHLAVAVLTDTLMPVLKATAAEPGTDVRVVVVSSRAHKDRPASAIGSLDTLAGWNACGGATGNGPLTRQARYGLSKYMNILYVRHLQRTLAAARVPITALALHPGVVATAGIVDVYGYWAYLVMRAIGITPARGAYTTLFAATAPEVKEEERYRGGYLVPYGQLVTPGVRDVLDEKRAKTLWDATERITADILARTDTAATTDTTAPAPAEAATAQAAS